MSSQSPQSGNEHASIVVRRADFDTTESVSTNVLLALDSLPEFDAKSSDEALFEHVDPDALDALFRSSPDGDRAGGWVYFPVGDYEVSVSARGEVIVRSDAR